MDYKAVTLLTTAPYLPLSYSNDFNSIVHTLFQGISFYLSICQCILEVLLTQVCLLKWKRPWEECYPRVLPHRPRVYEDMNIRSFILKSHLTLYHMNGFHTFPSKFQCAPLFLSSKNVFFLKRLRRFLENLIMYVIRSFLDEESILSKSRIFPRISLAIQYVKSRQYLQTQCPPLPLFVFIARV
jgi:hypothetical protein